MLMKMFKWTNDFEKDSKSEILSMLKQHEEKLIILKDNTEMEVSRVGLSRLN